MRRIAPKSINAAVSCRGTHRLTSALRRFGRSEDGSLLIFGMFAFVIMLLLAGISLDVMRAEERRTLLNNTMDRASLAAADLQQTLDPKAVVKDYFTKAGLEPPLDADIIVTEGTFGDSRKVKIKSTENVQTWFMNMVGVEELAAKAASTAEESVGQIEISLVLDVSGSMNSNSRLTNLKPAAKAFVDQIFDSAEADKVSISIVPYATQVSMSDDLKGYFDFNPITQHSDSTCIEFSPSAGDFGTTAVTLAGGGRLYDQNAHFDPFYKNSPPVLFNCPDNATQSNRQIMPFSGNRAALKTYIDGLTAAGNTSIDIGMKWGTALLDPSMQDVVTGMVTAGTLPSAFGGRPYEFDDADALKIVVLMTDGQNTTEYRMRNSTIPSQNYVSGQSRLYRNSYYTSNSVYQYSLWDESRNQYYVRATDSWRSDPWGDRVGDTGYSNGTPGPKAVPMTWNEVWGTMSQRYFSDNIIYNAYDSSNTRNKWRPSSVSNPIPGDWIYYEKDAQTLALCDAAKHPDRKIKIYTIAFEAPSSGRALLASCASSASNYYNVAGLDIEKAFSGIVNSINKLRLTQ